MISLDDITDVKSKGAIIIKSKWVLLSLLIK